MSYSTQPRLQALAALTALMVAACGGGGESSEPAVDAAPPPTTNPPPASPPPAPPPTALELSTKFLTEYDQRIATAFPATGAEAFALSDACYLQEGADKAFLIARYDASGAAAAGSNYSRGATARAIGTKRGNIRVLADRATSNPDGSQRREIDVGYDITYPDGTTDLDARQTLITGSSSGSCATPENQPTTRFFGNHKVISTGVIARNRETRSYSLSQGTPVSPETVLRRDIRFQVRDPGKVATYVVVTGPGPTAANGKPFGFKLLSPRLVRDAAELGGRPGTTGSLADDDGFGVCTTPTGGSQVPEPTIADCVGSGVQVDNWGRTLNGPVTPALIASQDAGFAAQGWVAGGVYTFEVYADDGWKTINGQSGKTPIATYTRTLEALPYSFAQMQNAPAMYPTITSTTPSLARIAELARTTGGTAQLNWAKAQPPTGGAPQGVLAAWVSGDGVMTGSTTGLPRVSDFAYFYPEPGATSADVPFTGKNPATDAKRYQSFDLYYGDRQGHVIHHTLQFY